MAQSKRESKQARPEKGPTSESARSRSEGKRRYRSRGVDVEIDESGGRVGLKLDGLPIDVELIDGEYHSQTANMWTSFSSVEEIVDTLLANEGRTWTLHGRVRGSHGSGGHADGHRGGQAGGHHGSEQAGTADDAHHHGHAHADEHDQGSHR